MEMAGLERPNIPSFIYPGLTFLPEGQSCDSQRRKEGKEMSDKDKKQAPPCYAGKIGHGGSQNVTAPFAAEKKSGGKVKEGNDLRTK